jgi:hypothetical protein
VTGPDIEISVALSARLAPRARRETPSGHRKPGKGRSGEAQKNGKNRFFLNPIKLFLDVGNVVDDAVSIGVAFPVHHPGGIL